MKVNNNWQRGFLTIEYSILIAIVIAALIGMAVYLKRAFYGSWRQSGDSIGSGRQYEPGVTKCYDQNGNDISCNK